MSDLPTVKEIVIAYLKEHGYDGLVNDGCGCWLDDIAPCECLGEECVPGHTGVISEADEDSDYPPGTRVIVPGPRKREGVNHAADQ